jgi:hypothetical protein
VNQEAIDYFIEQMLLYRNDPDAREGMLARELRVVDFASDALAAIAKWNPATSRLLNLLKKPSFRVYVLTYTGKLVVKRGYGFSTTTSSEGTSKPPTLANHRVGGFYLSYGLHSQRCTAALQAIENKNGSITKTKVIISTCFEDHTYKLNRS